MTLIDITGISRVTVFPLERLTVAYTTRSGDERCLGNIGIVAVVDESSGGDELWRLALSLGGRVSDGERARWILTQAHRARMVNAYTDLPGAVWAARIRRRFELGSLFANHDVLMTGGMRQLVAGVRPDPMPHRTPTS
ncbi:hypothetical protein ACWD1Z_16140 [Streptomyces sp. NPDC002784]